MGSIGNKIISQQNDFRSLLPRLVWHDSEIGILSPKNWKKPLLLNFLKNQSENWHQNNPLADCVGHMLKGLDFWKTGGSNWIRNYAGAHDTSESISDAS